MLVYVTVMVSSAYKPALSARHAIRQIGANLKRARLRRKLPMEVVADRARITRQTLAKVERGDTSVSIGIYATVMHALGLIDKLGDVANDPMASMLEDEALPKRIRARKKAAES